MSIIKSKKHKRNRRKPWHLISLVALLVIAAAALTAFYFHVHERGTSSHSKTVAGTTTPQPVTAKGTGTSNTSSTGSSSSPTKPTTGSSSASSPPSTSTATLVKPSGAFVSNHKPGSDGSPLVEASDCITTPGATCYISFSNGSVTKSLPQETADTSGAAYWQSWTPNSVGLTAGSWTITGYASLGQQTASTQDQTPLQVSP